MVQDDSGLGPGKLDGQVIIRELLRNMELGQFEMTYTTLLPCIFRIYLHPDDYSRLTGVFGLIADDARRALSARVSKMNTAPRVLGIPRGQPREHRIAASDWSIQFFADTEEAVPLGNVEVHSELSESEQPVLKGIRTTLIESEPTPGGNGSRAGTKTVSRTSIGAKRSADRIYGDIHYEDDTGPQVFLVTQNEVRIGRGAEDEPMDLALYTNDEVSREHLIIRRDPATGQFFVVDRSTNGTWLDGRRLKRDLECPLSDNSEINVAEVIKLRFQVRR